MWEPLEYPGPCFDLHFDRFDGFIFKAEKPFENVCKQGPKLKRARAKATVKAKGKSKQSSASIPEQAEDSEGAPNEESSVSEEHASDSGREKELEAAGPKESASSDALLFQGYDITGMPAEAHPLANASGKHSYTVRLPDGIAINVLVRNRAFWIKKPAECRYQYSWSQYDN